MLPVSILILILGLALAGSENCSASQIGPTAGDPSWTIAHSPEMPPTLTEQAGRHFFDFPTSKDGIHYVFRRAPNVQPEQTITMTFSLEGNGRLLPNEGRPPAKVRLFMQRQGDTLTAKEPYKRWWSKAYIELVSPGEFTLSAKIAPSEWTSVFGAVGSTVPAEFADCVANLAHLGFTFGGNFAGHGVYVTGGAVRFLLNEYSVK
jgi:hypothetical protein